MTYCMRVLALLCLSLTLLAPQHTLADDATLQTPGFEENLKALVSAKKSADKAALISQLAAADDTRGREVLVAMQDGRLYYRKIDKLPVYAEKVEAGFAIVDVASGEALGEVGKRKLKKISINNMLRNVLRAEMARLSLTDSVRDVRLAAAKDMLRSPDTDNLSLIESVLAQEKDTAVKEALQLASALIRLDADSEAERLVAVAELQGSRSKAVMVKLGSMLTADDDGQFAETSEKVRTAADVALREMKSAESSYKIVEDLFFGISLGSVLLLAAIGLAITFGVMGVINMAHGEMIMLGAYTTYVIQVMFPNFIEMSLIIAIPAAFLVSGTFGILIERLVIRHLYGRPLETLLATFGISLILQQMVRSVFSPLNKAVITPEWMSGSWEINGLLSLTYNRLYIIAFSLLVLFALVFLLKKTFVGLQMRAVTQNRAMANSMGIRAGWVDALTFGLGSGIAGIAGVALSQLTNVGPNLGQAYIIDSFMVVVFGGVGNLFGTFFAAMSLGIANKFIEPMAGAVLGKIIVLVFIILFIQWKPRGLFAIKGRFVED